MVNAVKNLSVVQFIARDIKLPKDSRQRARRDIAGMIGNNRGALVLRIRPDFVAAFAVASEFTAERTEFARQFAVGHAAMGRQICSGPSS